jgi:hypothetical protein
MQVPSATLAMIRFQLASGTRLSIRSAVPLLGAIVIAIGVSPDAGSTLKKLVLGVSTGREGIGASLVLAAMLVGVSEWALPRLRPATGGWIRHLPIDGAALRRSLLAALAAAQAPFLIASALLWLGGLLTGIPVEIVRLSALVVMALGAAFLVLPARRRWITTAMGALAILCCLPGRWDALALGAATIIVADLVAGPVERARSARLRPRLALSGSFVPALIVVRAIRVILPLAYLISLLPLAAAWLFIRNNRLEPSFVTAAARMGGACAMALLFSQVSAALHARRPPWSWLRTLPWSGAARVVSDAVVLGACALPFVVAGAFLDPRALPPLVLVLPLMAVRAAAAVHGYRESSTGPGGFVLAELMLVAVWLGITSWTVLPCLFLLPFALHTAGEKEKRQKVSLWSERHHLEAGDSASPAGR